MITERDESAAPIKDYLYRNGELIATSEDGTTYKYSTSDHLGSPRIWTDTNGNVVAGGRHDYLPFGEELFAGYGVRTTGQGYGISAQADGQRKQFTGKERDDETGLDNFGARYFSCNQGRFISPDPMLSSGSISDPRTWNRYSYTLNNPLKYADPVGLYQWDMSLGGGLTDDQLRDLAARARDFGVDPRDYQNILERRNAFREALETAMDAARDTNLTLSERLEVFRSANAYGEEGQNNGITVASGNLAAGVGADTTPLGYRYDQGGRVIGAVSRVDIDTNTRGDALAGAVAHEGTHIANRADAIAVWTISGSYNDARGSMFNLTQYQDENRAYHVSTYVARYLDLDSLTYQVGGQRYQIWSRGMQNVDQQVLDRLLNAHYGVRSTPATSQGPTILP